MKNIKKTDKSSSIYRAFPTETLPEPMSSYVREVAASIGCDPSFVAMPLLSALAAASGNSRRLRISDTWTEPSILWIGIIGESGTLKSPAITAALKFTVEREQEKMQQYEQGIKKWHIEQAALLKNNAGSNESVNVQSPCKFPSRQDVPIPRCERFYVCDTTTEAVMSLLKENPRGLILIRDELSGWVNGMDRYHSKSGSDLATWLEFHGGRPCTVDRKKANSFSIPNASVSICGGIQPGILQRGMDQQIRDSGMMARFLLVYPPRKAKKWTEGSVAKETESKLADVFDQLFNLEMIESDGILTPLDLQFDDDAVEEFASFVNEHGQEQLNTSGDLAAAYSKLEGYVARIALIFQLVRAATDDKVSSERVDIQSLLAAEKLVKWLVDETVRVYSLMGMGDPNQYRLRILEQLVKNGGQITVRELTRCIHTLNAQGAMAELQALVDAKLGAWLPQPKNKPGSPSQVFILACVDTKSNAA